MTAEPLMTAAEVGEMIGFKAATILDWFEAGKLPGLKVGRAVRFDPAEIRAWIGQGRSESPGARRPVSCGCSDSEASVHRFYDALKRRHGVTP